MTTSPALHGPKSWAIQPNRPLRLTVAEIHDLAGDVRRMVLASTDGARLSSFTPGSHLLIRWASRRYNAYSLTGPLFEPDFYVIAVRARYDGLGGSAYVHNLSVGDEIVALGPRSSFAPVLDAKHHVLVAGGIGVTPILSHARSHVAMGRSFEVHFGTRDDALVGELIEVAGDAVNIYRTRAEMGAAIDDRLREQRIGAHLYLCGPAAMAASVRGLAQEAHWPAGRIHEEVFSAEVLDPGEAFCVELPGGRRIEVPRGVSMLAALESVGIAVPNMCRRGYCGECITAVRSGELVHRDSILRPSERDGNDRLTPCVSRGRGVVQIELQTERT